MKYFFKISILICIILLALPDDADAQPRGRKKKKSDKKEHMDWTQRMWYGGGFIVNFGSSGFAGGLSGNEFAIGLSPMAGYKFNNWLSVGPRVEFTYFTGRYRFGGQGQVFKLNALSYGVGPFVRAKTNFNIFAHVEYQYYSNEFTDGQITADNKLKTIREDFEAFYAGLGYTSSDSYSRWGYEIYIVYDLLAPENSVNLPLDYRFGITYNF